MKLQELPESVPVGEMPRSITLLADRGLVDRCTAGTRVTVVGIFTATESSPGGGSVISKKSEKGTNMVKFSYVMALGLDVAQGNTNGGNGAIPITTEEEERFHLMAKDANIREKIYASIAPSIKGSKKDVTDEVKKAVACLLFGGARNVFPDGTRRRGDINVLLLGDPSTAKSQFLKFAQNTAPIAAYTSGKGSSAAGLTAAVVRESGSNGGFALEGGAMVLADGGVVCIDEFDKMRPDDRVAIHEAMEQQTISIAKAGITTVLNTRCSVLAAANPLYGSWDETTELGDQLDMATTILSRFDLIFLVKDVRDEERDQTLAKHVLELHQKGVAEQTVEADIPVALFRKYLTYVRRNCFPRISERAESSLENHYIRIRSQLRKERNEGGGNTIPITVRQLEALARISESFARMEMSEEATEDHVEHAIELFTIATVDAANRHIAVNPSAEDINKIKEVEERIQNRVPIGGKKQRDPLIRELQREGFDGYHVKKAIQALTQRGILTERGDYSIQRVR